MKNKNRWMIPFRGMLLALAISSCGGLLDPGESGNLVPRTVDEDPLLPRIEVNGSIFHAESFGGIHNPIMIFLHGGPGSDYRSMISQIGVENASRYPSERTITNGGLSQLQDAYYCVFYDQRGAGLSPRFNSGKVDFDMYVQDLDAIIDYYLHEKEIRTGLVDTQVVLFGWSFGGVLATGYINRYQDKVKDVILYEPGPLTKDVYDHYLNISSPFTQIGKDWLDEWLLSLDHITGDDQARADYRYLLGANRSSPEFHENRNQPFWRVGANIGDDIDDFGSVIKDDKLVSNLSGFRGRMMFMHGDKTTAMNDTGVSKQMSYYPRSEKMVIPGTGHSGPWEKSNEVAAAIRRFLAP